MDIIYDFLRASSLAGHSARSSALVDGSPTRTGIPLNWKAGSFQRIEPTAPKTDGILSCIAV